MSKILIAYIPVLHQGYVKYLAANKDVQTIYLLDRDLKAEFPQLRKDVRALSATDMQVVLEAVNLGPKIDLLSSANITEIAESGATITMPDEDIMHALAEKYFAKNEVGFESVYLRWDSQKSLTHQEIEANQHLSQEKFDQEMMQLAYDQAKSSADWWRQVGAVLVKDGQVVLTAKNHHVPDAQEPYYEGDPRGNFHKGEYIELSTAMHAEAEIITQAAKQGLSTEGATLYASTFPCPVCAKLVAYSGIKKVYYAEGYSMVNGAELMQDQGIELIKVEPAGEEKHV